MLSQSPLLVDGFDAQGAGLRDGQAGDRPAVEQDLTGVRPVDAGDDLDQRRLAGSVVAEQADHLTGSQLEVDVAQDVHAAE